MKIILLQPQSGIGGVGTEIEVSDSRGLRWIDKGFAVAAGGQPVAAVEPIESEPKPKKRLKANR